MSGNVVELPLFPLNVVLFPGVELPLHIFEPRYRLMITECRQEKKPFGVVLVRPESEALNEDPYPVGTMAEIQEIDRLEDGRFNLIAIGTQRFRILRQHRNKPYLSGLVEPYKDIAEPARILTPYATQAQDLFSSYIEMLLDVVGMKTVQIELPTVPEELSYLIAYLLDISDEQKQHFLELTSTLQRLQEEISVLHREIPFIRQMNLLGKRYLEDPDRSKLN